MATPIGGFIWAKGNGQLLTSRITASLVISNGVSEETEKLSMQLVLLKQDLDGQSL